MSDNNNNNISIARVGPIVMANLRSVCPGFVDSGQGKKRSEIPNPNPTGSAIFTTPTVGKSGGSEAVDVLCRGTTIGHFGMWRHGESVDTHAILRQGRRTVVGHPSKPGVDSQCPSHHGTRSSHSVVHDSTVQSKQSAHRSQRD